ncbi:hypothetical protein [Planktothricoides raciborskii]|uniref:Uncharacterized protein n=1 Tax=Planktothricoides raciborskii FACHB-1370 TaxID=2949576 RepID=A0ABR8EJA8_9CYAN|nr:hypothetical protein [Planktothricoides raciborskii]MBD2546711.1 hypothetical protein [Planktothricoides raciborskii FACHB-1370]MBD2585443.1 hypothetical protein [Planktothricoides raciborskii FACHB-1261]
MLKHPIWLKLAWTITSMPSIYLVLFYSYVLRARLVLGRWPIPYQPDPRELGFDFHFQLIFFSLLGIALSLFAMAVVFILRIFSVKIRKFSYSLAALIYSSSLVLSWISLYADPGDFWEWFMD